MGCRIILIIKGALPRHPLSERGEGTASGRSDSEAVNENEGRGVSHYESKHITMDNTNLNDFEKDFLKILSAATR